MADDIDSGAESQDPQPPEDSQREPVDGKAGKQDGNQADHERDQFAEATSDPFADALGGTAGAGIDQAYRTWVGNVESAGAFVGGGNIGVLNISTGVDLQSRLRQAPGPVPREVLDRLTSRYALVAGYETFVSRLASTRLLLLRGAPGTGRVTTGLRLLAEIAGDVARLSPETDLRSIARDNLEHGVGYLLELATASAISLSTAHVDRLRDLLAQCECYLVVVAPHDIRYRNAFDGYIVDCPLPDPQQVLGQAIEDEARKRPDLAEALRRAAADAKLNGSGAARTPSEVGWFVTHLVSRVPGTITPDDLARLSTECLYRHVAGWFEPLANVPPTAEADEQVRLAAFQVALAVFNGTPFDLVAEAGEKLTRRILTARSPRRTPGRPVFANYREDYLANSRAHLAPGVIKFLGASAPATFAAYDDERLPYAVLRHVWGLHNLRGPLVSWLQSLSDDNRPFVYTRAALALGLLSSWDFSYTFHELIEPWAKSPDKGGRRQWVAAIALDQASRNSEVQPVVLEALENWCRKGTFAQRRTGATALGYAVGLRDPAKALKELRKLGCWKDGALASVASWAIARIFGGGVIEPVLDALRGWLDDDRLAVRQLGMLAVLRIAAMKVSELDDLDLTGQVAESQWNRLAGRSRWPLLVALSADDPALLDPLADLVWRVTRSAQAQLSAKDVLAQWVRAGEKDRSCVGQVGRFLALLGDDDSDRERLLHLVDALRRDRDEPLPSDIADRLARAITTNSHAGDD